MANVNINYNRGLGVKKGIILNQYAQNVTITDNGTVVKSHAGLATERTLLEHSLLRTTAGGRLILHDYKSGRVPARFALIGYANTHHCVCRGQCVCVGLHLWEHTIHKRPISYIANILDRGDRVFSIELDYSGPNGKCVYDLAVPAQPGGAVANDCELTWSVDVNHVLSWKLKGQALSKDVFHTHGSLDHNTLDDNRCVYKETVEEVKYVKLVQYQICVAAHPKVETGYDQVPIIFAGHVLFWAPGTVNTSAYVMYRPKHLFNWIYSKMTGVNVIPPRVIINPTTYNHLTALWTPAMTPAQLEMAVRAYVKANNAVTEGQPADVWISVVVANMTYRNATLRDSFLQLGQTTVPSWGQIAIAATSLLFGYEWIRYRVLSGRWIPRLNFGINLKISAPSLSVQIPEVSDEVLIPLIEKSRHLVNKVKRIYGATKNSIFPQPVAVKHNTQALIDQGWVSYQSYEPFLPWRRILGGLGICALGVSALVGCAWLGMRQIRESVRAEMEEEDRLNNLLSQDPRKGIAARAQPEKRGETVAVQTERIARAVSSGNEAKEEHNVVVVPHDQPQPGITTPAVEVVSQQSHQDTIPGLIPVVVSVQKIEEDVPPPIDRSTKPVQKSAVQNNGEPTPRYHCLACRPKVFPTSICVYKDEGIRPDVVKQYGLPQKLDERGLFLSCGLMFDYGTNWDPVIPTVFSNSYSNFVATLATRVLNDRPETNPFIWATLRPYMSTIVKNVRANPITVQEWVETCNPSKRRHYARALEECVKKYGNISHVPRNAADSEKGLQSFVKVELLPCQYKEFSSVKPRNIMGAADVYQMFWGPYVRSIDAQLKAQFKLGSWSGPRRNLQWFKVSGVNVKELNDLITASIRLITMMHTTQLKDSNYVPYIIMFACGDDNWTVFCSKEYGVLFFFSDFSKYDKTHSAESLEFTRQYYLKCGISSEDVKTWKRHSKVLKGTGVSQRNVKFRCEYNLATGAPDTSLRNTVVGVAVGLYVLDTFSNRVADPYLLDNSHDLALMYDNFGFEAKCNVCQNILNSDFLQGRFLEVSGRYYWVPKIGRVLAKFGFKAVWKGDDNSQDTINEEARVHLKSVALCYRDCYYPAIRHLAQGILEQCEMVIAEPDESQFYKVQCTGYTGPENDALCDLLIEPVSNLYNIKTHVLKHFCEVLRTAPIGSRIHHPAFDAMLEADVPDWFTK